MRQAVAGLVWVSLSTIALGYTDHILRIDRTYAQVLPDSTLGTTVQTPNNLDFTIDSGTSSGTNLFHSFREFSIPTGGSATFNNTTNIQNIFSRVTGGTVSNIDGAIRAQGSANLFLLNPAGILFGSNASLNIGGSFVGTAAQAIKFADGMEFSATNLNDRPLLTMSVPIGLQIGQNPGAIVNRAAGAVGFQGYPVGLRVNRGQTLALIGGDITVDKAGMQAREGAIALGSVGANQLVTLTPKSAGWAFDYSTVSDFRNILIQRSMLDVNGDGAGSIDTVGRNILIHDGGRLMARNLAGTTRDAQGGIQLKASESLEIKSGFPFPGSGCTIEYCNSLVSTTTLSRGRGGDIFVEAPNIRLLDGGQFVLGGRGSGAGDSGKLTLRGETIEMRGVNRIFASGSFGSITNGASGLGGDVDITTKQLRILDGGLITVSTTSSFGSTRVGESLTATGTAGSINIKASDLVEISGSGTFSTGVVSRSGLQAAVASDAQGAGGRINIVANRLSITNNGEIKTTTEAKQSTNDAGNIKITANLVFLRSLANIETNSTDSNGGNITIDSPIIVGLDNSNITANAGRGRGGNIHITTQSIIGLEFRNTLNPRIDPTNDITASSEIGFNGTVQINNINVDLNSGLVELPSNLNDASQQIAEGCSSTQGSSFVLTGRGGIPQDPAQEVRAARAWKDLRNFAALGNTATRATRNFTETTIAPILKPSLVEATSWQRNPQTGKVELTAARSAPPNMIATCATTSKS